MFSTGRPYLLFARLNVGLPPAREQNKAMAAELVLAAGLHNQIVRLGWHVTSTPFVTFWEKHSKHQREMEELLSEDVVTFYKKALVPAASVSADDLYQNFFYYLQGLAPPWDRDDLAGHLLSKLNGREGASNKSFDQISGQASVQADFSSVEPSSMVWQPLSTILTGYLNMITLGKITSTNFNSTSETSRAGESESHHPWKHHSYSSEILERTLAAYHGLIDAIEAARNIPVEGRDHELTVYLSTHFNLDAANFPKACFARSFLTAARRPRGPRRMEFIAPGIGLPSTTSIRNQPFGAAAKKYRFSIGTEGLPPVGDVERSHLLYPPILLFPGQGIKSCEKDAEGKSVFSAPFDELVECPAGLWLDRAEPWSGQGGEDEAVLFVPFGVSHQAYIPLAAGTTLPLFMVLNGWTKMVSSGRWKVDERGVVGGNQLLREEKLGDHEVRGRNLVQGIK